MKRRPIPLLLTVLTGILFISFSYAQPPGPPGFGPPGPGMGGPRGPGGPTREERKLVKQYDVDHNGWLDNSERTVARKAIQSEREERGGPGFGGPGFGGPGRHGGPGRGGPSLQPATPGPAVTPEDVAVYPDKPLYDTGLLRTLFLEFENDDWEIELEDFHGTDVDVAATLTVDGKTYPNVGVHYRGMSSYDHVQRGSKRSFNLSLDMADEDQRIDGYKTLNLLNSHGDPSMMSSVVYSHIARQYLAAPKANFVHVVVNGRSWGLYDSVQQFDKTFLAENFSNSKGTRWKVSGNPGADGGLRYLGDDLAEYKSRFEMKSNDGKKEWAALIQLCKTLNETPTDQLVAALDPILDIDGTLKFLALDVALVNGDGYWTRASDYCLYRDSDGKFHLVPHDMNEAFALSSHGRGPDGFGFGPPPGFGGRDGRGRGGPPPGFGGPDGRGPGGPPPGFGRGPGGPGGGPGGPGHGGVDLDPLVGLDNERMPLRSRLLAVPELRQRYLQYVNQIAEESLDWQQLGPVVDGYRDLIAPTVKEDTRKLSTYEAFLAATRSDSDGAEGPMSLRKFAVERSEFLRAKR